MAPSIRELRELRNDPEFVNYIASGEAQIVLCKGLRQYCEQVAKDLQEQLKKQHGASVCTCLCQPGIKPCRHSCKWGKALMKLHKNKKKSRVPFYQSDHTMWHDMSSGYWELAKVFMSDLGVKWRDVTDPATTDLTGLLNFLIFYKPCKVQPGLLTAVRDVRNVWAHSYNYKLTSSEKQDAFNAIEQLMNDGELSSCKEVQDCRKGIQEIKTTDVSIVQERELEVLKELTRHLQLQRETHLEEKREELTNMIQLILASKQNSINFLDRLTVDGQLKKSLLCIILLPLRFMKECSRWKFCTFLMLVMLLLSCVSDNSVLETDKGCQRPIEINSFGFNEFDFSPHLSGKRENFVGRSWFFRELDDIFEKSDAPLGVLITGDPGSGKSALLSQLICSPFSSSEIHYNIIGYHICDYSEKGKQNGGRFVRNLVHQIASNILEYKSYIRSNQRIQTELIRHCFKDPTSCFFTTIVGPLKDLEPKYCPKNYKYIVIDALDECLQKGGETSEILDILHYKISFFPPWLKIIISSRREARVTSSIPSTVTRIHLDPKDEGNIADIRSYIARYLRKKFSFFSKLYRAISPLAESINAKVSELLERADGNFLFVRTFLQNNLDRGGMFNFNSRSNILDDIYKQLFHRYVLKEDFHRYEIIFEVLLANGSLSTRDFSGILKRANEGEEMDELVERVSGLLHMSNEFVSFYHQSFAEWLMDNHIQRFSIQKRRGHDYVANFLVDRLQSNPNVTFNELSQLSFHVMDSGGPSDYHKENLRWLNVSKIRNAQDGKCILHELAQRANGSRLLSFFLSNITSVDILDVDRKTPAFYAASKGLVENLKLLLHKGTCANCILKEVSSLGDIQSVIQMKGYEELSTMHIATYNGHREIVKALLKHNASFFQVHQNMPGLLHLAAERGNLEMVKLLYNSGNHADSIALHHAAARNNSQVVRYLLETAGATDGCLQCKQQYASNFRNISFYDLHVMFCETALHAAVSKRLTKIVKLLLQFGKSSLNCKHHSGKTPLMDAIERNDSTITELLLQNGANVDDKCGEKRSLSLYDPKRTGARYFYGTKFLYTFYREKTYCPCGSTGLHLCANYGLWHMAKYLINNWNASLLVRNCNGESVWKIANVSYNQDFIFHINQMLLNLDADPAKFGMGKYGRRTFKKLLKKFFIRTKPYDSSFQCDSTFEGISPLHIAAIMGVDMLNRVYKKAHEIAPSLPLNCTNKHWITPTYLAYFYDNIHALSGETRKTHLHDTEYTTMLQYPDREAELHMIFNYFYHSPSPESNVLAYRSLPLLPNYDVANCPGFYDLLPESKTLRVKPYCDSIRTRHDDEYHDPDKASLRRMEQCEKNQVRFCLCIDDFEFRMWQEQYARDCFCPVFMWELQRWFTRIPKHNRRINRFIAERMGWKEFSNGEYEKRWPVYFLYKKIKNEYHSYKYLEILNKGFKIDDEDSHLSD